MLTRLYEVPGRRNRFESMEGLRAYAAFLIFLVHYFYFYVWMVWRTNLNSLRLDTIPDLETAIYYFLFRSHYGVDIFFLLSGFLVFRMMQRPNFRYDSFLRSRISRIYPALLFTTAIYFVFTIHKNPFDLLQFLGNIFVLNGVPGSTIKGYNIATWSIFYELSFYILFPLLFLLTGGRNRTVTLSILLIGVFILLLAVGAHAAYIRYLMFLGGVFLASLSPAMLSRIDRALPETVVVILYFASTAFYVTEHSFLRFTPVYLVTSVLLVHKVLFGEGWLHRIFAWRPVRYFGNVSYSFYLIQLFTIKIGFFIVPISLIAYSRHLYLLATLTASFCISLIVATLLYQLLERPYFSRSHTVSKVRPGST